MPNTATVNQQSLLLDVVQQLIALDAQGAFTGQLTEDGRIGADGPVTHVNLRQVGQLSEQQLAVAGGRHRWLWVSWTSHTLCRRQTLHKASALEAWQQMTRHMYILLMKGFCCLQQQCL